jgi:hypothetical protein
MDQKRGALTPRVQREAEKLLGYATSVTELRLMPYVMHVMMNSQKLEPAHISKEEREVLRSWREHGFIEGGAGGLTITQEFWGAICRLVCLAYVDLDVPAD